MNRNPRFRTRAGARRSSRSSPRLNSPSMRITSGSSEEIWRSKRQGGPSSIVSGASAVAVAGVLQVRAPGRAEHGQEPVLERAVQDVARQARVPGVVGAWRGRQPHARGAEQQRHDFAIRVVDEMLGLLRRQAGLPRLAPLAVLLALAEQHVDDRAVARARVADVNRVDDLAVREARLRERTLGGGDIMAQLGEELLPGGGFWGGRDGRSRSAGVLRVSIRSALRPAGGILGLEHRIFADRAVARQQAAAFSLEQRRPDVLTDVGAIGVPRALAGGRETVAVAHELDPVVARAPDNGVRGPLAAAHLDDRAGAEIARSLRAGAEGYAGDERGRQIARIRWPILQYSAALAAQTRIRVTFGRCATVKRPVFWLVLGLASVLAGFAAWHFFPGRVLDRVARDHDGSRHGAARGSVRLRRANGSGRQTTARPRRSPSTRRCRRSSNWKAEERTPSRACCGRACIPPIPGASVTSARAIRTKRRCASRRMAGPTGSSKN